jgi:DNA-binding LacI/PurR family transcriptional regulator
MDACDAARIGVPDELSVVSFGRIGADSHHVARAISGLTVDPHRVGRAAGGAMLGWLAGARPADSLRIECGSFVARATTGKATPKNH